MTERLHFHFSLSCIGEEMATHSIALAWRIPGTGEPDGLPSMGSHRVGHDWSDLAAAAAAIRLSQAQVLYSKYVNLNCNIHEKMNIIAKTEEKVRHLPLWKSSPLVNQWSCLLDNLSSIYQLLYLMDLYLYVCLFTCLFNFLSFLLCCLKKKINPHL